MKDKHELYGEDKYGIEESFKDQVLKVLWTKYPTAVNIKCIKSYTIRDKSTKKLQILGADFLVFLLDGRVLRYDAKCFDKYNKFTAVLLEIKRGKVEIEGLTESEARGLKVNLKDVYDKKPGWIKGANDVPLSEQFILLICHGDAIIINKEPLISTVRLYNGMFKETKLHWWIDYGTIQEECDTGTLRAKGNALLFLDRLDHQQLILRMGAERFSLTNGECVPVDIFTQYPLKYGYSSNKGPVGGTTDPSR